MITPPGVAGDALPLLHPSPHASCIVVLLVYLIGLHPSSCFVCAVRHHLGWMVLTASCHHRLRGPLSPGMAGVVFLLPQLAVNGSGGYRYR